MTQLSIETAGDVLSMGHGAVIDKIIGFASNKTSESFAKPKSGGYKYWKQEFS